MKNAKLLSELEIPETDLDQPRKEDISSPAEEDISLLDLFIVVARYRRRILLTVLATTLAGALLAFILPVRYTATTSILPPQQGASAGSALLAQLSALNPLASVASGGLGLKNPGDLQVALLKSRTVEDAMVVRFHLMELFHKQRMSDARDKLEKIIDIGTSTKDPLIRVSATDPDPQRATDLANGYVEEFKRLSDTLAVTEASQRRVFFEDQLRQAKDNLANAEEELKITEQKTGLIQLDSQARAAIESVASLRAQVSAKEVQISSLRLFATGDNPQLSAAEQELATLQTELAKIGSSATGSTPQILGGGLQQQGLEYVRKLRDVKYYETIFELLARQLEVAKVDEARQGATIQVVDKALKPDRHSFPKRTYIVLGSFVVGWVFGIGWAFGSEGIRRIKRNPAERARLDSLREELSSKKENHNPAGAA